MLKVSDYRHVAVPMTPLYCMSKGTWSISTEVTSCKLRPVGWQLRGCSVSSHTPHFSAKLA